MKYTLTSLQRNRLRSLCRRYPAASVEELHYLLRSPRERRKEAVGEIFFMLLSGVIVYGVLIIIFGV